MNVIDGLANMNSSSSVSSAPTSPSKLTNAQNRNVDNVDDVITINEKVNLTKQQHQVLKMICNTYELPISEYMQQALVEAMRFDIEEGNFSDALLEKIGSEDNKKDNNSTSSPSPNSLAPDLMKSDLDLLKKLQTQI
jgi:Tfp pilus tip-associated adhesin PilY1